MKNLQKNKYQRFKRKEKKNKMSWMRDPRKAEYLKKMADSYKTLWEEVKQDVWGKQEISKKHHLYWLKFFIYSYNGDLKNVIKYSKKLETIQQEMLDKIMFEGQTIDFTDIDNDKFYTKEEGLRRFSESMVKDKEMIDCIVDELKTYYLISLLR